MLESILGFNTRQIMRKLFKKLLLVLVLFTCSIAASYSQTYNWTKVINAIAIVESNNNPRAMGGGGSVGLLQITPILVRDCNKILAKQNSTKRYTLADRYNPEKSKEMFVIRTLTVPSARVINILSACFP